MRNAIPILGFIAWLCAPHAVRAISQAKPVSHSEPTIVQETSSAQTIDGVAARIEDDIIMESQIRELAAFQQLVDGESKPRLELIRELADQWIVRGEAVTAKYPQPTPEQTDLAYQDFVKQFGSSEEFEKRRADVGLSDAAVRRMLAQQFYLSHFIDYRFRAAAQVDDKQVEAYYNDEFAPQLKAKGQPVPPLEEVDDTIREVLIQRAITERATKWLYDTRQRLKIDVSPQGSGS
jgi:hypothetical protein